MIVTHDCSIITVFLFRLDNTPELYSQSFRNTTLQVDKRLETVQRTGTLAELIEMTDF